MSPEGPEPAPAPTPAGIGQLAAALAKAQGEMQPAKKDSENPFFKSSYADLAAIWAACRVPLSSNGLAVLQYVEDGELVTALVHTSGERVDSRMGIQAKKDGDVQSLGSTLTYLRRYALAALVGVVAEGEDDDGNASAHDGKPSAAKREPARPAPANALQASKPLPPAATPAPAGALACPLCRGEAKKQAHPVPGKTHFCTVCAHAFEPPK